MKSDASVLHQYLIKNIEGSTVQKSAPPYPALKAEINKIQQSEIHHPHSLKISSYNWD